MDQPAHPDRPPHLRHLLHRQKCHLDLKRAKIPYLLLFPDHFSKYVASSRANLVDTQSLIGSKNFTRILRAFCADFNDVQFHKLEFFVLKNRESQGLAVTGLKVIL